MHFTINGVIAICLLIFFWNYLKVPIYMEYPCEAVAKLLVAVFLME